MKDLSINEKLFGCYCTSVWGLKEAAIKAGYKLFPERMGMKLLKKTMNSGELKGLKKQLKCNMPDVISGYERLAFGNVGDAVRLLFCKDAEDTNFELMDFFNVSEIKKLKDGGMEIKFFDRFKALEALRELLMEENSKTPPLYRAILDSTKALSDGEDCAV